MGRGWEGRDGEGRGARGGEGSSGRGGKGRGGKGEGRGGELTSRSALGRFLHNFPIALRSGVFLGGTVGTLPLFSNTKSMYWLLQRKTLSCSKVANFASTIILPAIQALYTVVWLIRILAGYHQLYTMLHRVVWLIHICITRLPALYNAA